MKLPFFKKSKPAPAPEAPAAPRAPFPFAAPEQDEPVPAIHIDARVLAFLRKYGAAPDQLDTQELTDALLAAMQRGLRGEAGGLPMLPAYLAPHGHVAAPEGKRVAVIDAGGTNFRVATVHYEFGQPILEDERTLPMPGSEQDADWMDFIRLAADVLEPLLDFTQALDNDIVVHPEGDVTFMFPQGGDVPRNLVCSGTSDFGDLDEAFAQSDIVFTRTYTSQATQTAPMETFRAFATTDAFGRISVTTSTQVPFHVRRMVAQSLDIPQSQVQVIKPRIGGGFGSKQTGCCEIFVAFVTQQTGRPSYCCYTREETITAGNSRHQMQMTVKLGAMNDGTITAIDLHTLSNAGAYGEHATTTIGLSGHKSLPIYNHVKASRFSWDAVYTNTNRGGAYRGYGATQGQFAVESAVNELADMLHMDPADLRLKNIVREGEIMPQYYNEKLNACALDRCLLRAMDMIGWRDKPLAVDLGDRVRALGCALTMQGSGISNVDIAGIDMRLEEDGFITIGTGATDNGMGVDTILAQIAAEELGVELEITDMAFDALLISLQQGKFDLVAAGVTYSPERYGLFSDPYYVEGQAVLIRTEDLDTYTTAESLSGCTVGAKKGTVQAELAANMAEDVTCLELVKFPDLVTELKQDKIEAIVVDYVVAEDYLTAHDDLAISDIVLEDGQVNKCVVAQEGNQELIDVVNAVIAEGLADGSFDSLMQQAKENAQYEKPKS